MNDYLSNLFAASGIMEAADEQVPAQTDEAQEPKQEPPATEEKPTEEKPAVDKPTEEQPKEQPNEQEEDGPSDSEAIAGDANKPIESEDKTSEPKPEHDGKLPADAENGESVVEKELTYWAFIYDFSQFKQAKSRVKLEDYFMKVMPVKDGPFQNPHTMKLRVRKVETDGQPKYELTMKVGSNYANRVENTVEIPESTFILYSKILTTRTAKHRYEFEDEHGTWYVDLFPNGAGGYHNWAQVELEYTNLDKVPHPPIKYEEIVMPKGSGVDEAEREAKYQKILSTIKTLEQRNPNLPAIQQTEAPVQDNTPVQPEEQPEGVEDDRITVDEISTTDEQKEANEAKLGKDADNPDEEAEDGDDASQSDDSDTSGSDGSDGEDGSGESETEPEEKPEGDAEKSEEPEQDKGEADTSETASQDKPVTESLQLLCSAEKDVNHIIKIGGYASDTMRRDTNTALMQASRLVGVTESINEDALSNATSGTGAFTEEAKDRVRNQINSLLAKLASTLDASTKRFNEMNPDLKPTELAPETQNRLSMLDEVKNIIQTNSDNYIAATNASAPRMQFLNNVLTNHGNRSGRLAIYVQILKGISAMFKDLGENINTDAIRNEFSNVENAFTNFLLPRSCEKVKQSDEADVYTLRLGSNTVTYTLNKDKEGLPINIVVTDLVVNKTVMENLAQSHAGMSVDLGSAAAVKTAYGDNVQATKQAAEFVANMKTELTTSLESIKAEMSNALQADTKDDYWLGRVIVLARSIINMMIAEIAIISYGFHNSHENQSALSSLIMEQLSPYSFSF